MASTISTAETSSSHQILSATYSSPTNSTFSHIHKLPTPTSDQVRDRTLYLAELRKATVTMQERINKELTSRMEDDKVREASGVNGTNTKVNGGVIDEAKEEDNYGEEVVEEED